VTACQDCGQTHRTGLDGIRCDLNQWGKDHTCRFHHDVLGLTHTQIDDLFDQAVPSPHDTRTQP
jgi:hypothetical protein